MTHGYTIYNPFSDLDHIDAHLRKSMAVDRIYFTMMNAKTLQHDRRQKW